MASDSGAMSVLVHAALASGLTDSSAQKVPSGGAPVQVAPSTPTAAPPSTPGSARQASGVWMPKEVKRLMKAVDESLGRGPDVGSAGWNGAAAATVAAAAAAASAADAPTPADRDPEQVADTIDWNNVARSHVRTREAAECRKKWIELQKYPLLRGKWSPEEDMRLRQAVEKFGSSAWTRVADMVKTRSPQQCLHRWTKSLVPTIRRTRWDEQEDMILRQAVAELGTNWALVRGRLEGRTDMQCRERWVNVLCPYIARSPWAAHEDQTLLRLIQEIGPGHWSKIANRYNQVYPDFQRTDYQIRKRWKKLSGSTGKDTESGAAAPPSMSDDPGAADAGREAAAADGKDAALDEDEPVVTGVPPPALGVEEVDLGAVDDDGSTLLREATPPGLDTAPVGGRAKRARDGGAESAAKVVVAAASGAALP